MSTLRNTAWTLAATVALGSSTMATGLGASTAEASTPSHNACAGGANVYCSMYYARHIPGSLGSGARGGYVRDLQHALREVHVPVRVTGIFDAQTKSAVKRYQSSRKIKTTGYYGYSTAHALRVGAGPKRAKKKVTSSVNIATVNSSAQEAVNFAYAQIGKPYIYGATGPGGYDCSGLTSAAWRSAGVSIPRTSGAQMNGLQRVSRSSARPGDIVVFYGGGHVGIYAGNGYVIHAPRTGQNVKKVAMSSMPVTAVVRPA